MDATSHMIGIRLAKDHTLQMFESSSRYGVLDTGFSRTSATDFPRQAIEPRTSHLRTLRIYSRSNLRISAGLNSRCSHRWIRVKKLFDVETEDNTIDAIGDLHFHISLQPQPAHSPKQPLSVCMLTHTLSRNSLHLPTAASFIRSHCSPKKHVRD